jgi:hypothetical protein
MLCLSSYYLFLLFNGTGENTRTGSAWKPAERTKRVEAGAMGRIDPKNVCTENK